MKEISAIILAAGLSVRMGKPKMLLPWDDTTVIGKVVSTIENAGIEEVLVVTGGIDNEVKQALSAHHIHFIINPDYSNGEMLASVQVGLGGLPETSTATLIVLGDQPQIEKSVVQLIVDRYQHKGDKIIVPSYQMHRGHPWLVDRSLWDQISEMKNPATLHTFLNLHQEMIHYVVVDTESVMQDLDTPEDYHEYKP